MHVLENLKVRLRFSKLASLAHTVRLQTQKRSGWIREGVQQPERYVFEALASSEPHVDILA